MTNPGDFSGQDHRGKRFDLRQGSLARAQFSHANLQDADLSDHDLTAADFSGADLRGATFTNSRLRGANFARATAGIGPAGRLRFAAASTGVVALSLSLFVLLVAFLGVLARSNDNPVPILLGVAVIAAGLVGLFQGELLSAAKTMVGAYVGVAMLAAVFGLLSFGWGAASETGFASLDHAIRIGMAGIAALGITVTFCCLAIAFALQFASLPIGGAILLLCSSGIGFIVCTGVMSSALFGSGPFERVGFSDMNPARWLVGGTLGSMFCALIALSGYVAVRALAGDSRFRVLADLVARIGTRAGTSFRKADLSDADFTGARVDYTDFSGARFIGSTWHRTRGLHLVVGDLPTSFQRMAPVAELGDPLVFIAHASEDAHVASLVYEYLERSGIRPWLSSRDLQPGEKWELVIESVMRRANRCLVLLSHHVTRKGYLHREVKLALATLDELPDRDVFVIPVRLDDCELPHDRLSDLHVVDVRPSFETAMEKVVISVKGRHPRSGNHT